MTEPIRKADNASPRSDKKEVFAQGLPSPHVDPIDTYKKPVEMEEEIRRNALTDGVATPPCIYRTGCQEADKCAKAEHCTAPIGDDFTGCRPPMRHIAGVNEETLRSAGGVALGGKEQQIEHALSRCDGCVKPDVCAAGKCFRGFPVRADSVLGTYKGKPE